MARYKGIERRRHKRLNKLMAVNIIALNDKKTLPKFDAEIGLNIAEGGMLLECSKRLTGRSRLKLKILLTLDSSRKTGSRYAGKYKVIRAPAIIVWNKKSFRNTYYLGCKFTRLKHKDRLILRRFHK